MFRMWRERIAGARAVLVSYKAFFLSGDGRGIADRVLKRAVTITRLHTAFYFGGRPAA